MAHQRIEKDCLENEFQIVAIQNNVRSKENENDQGDRRNSL